MQKKQKKNFLAMIRDRKGVSMIEYALLAALLALVSVGVLTNLGGAVEDKFTALEKSVGAVKETPTASTRTAAGTTEP